VLHEAFESLWIIEYLGENVLIFIVLNLGHRFCFLGQEEFRGRTTCNVILFLRDVDWILKTLITMVATEIKSKHTEKLRQGDVCFVLF